MRDSSRFSRRDGDEVFSELKRISESGVEIWFYQDGTRFTFGTFGDNVVGFVRAEMNAEYRRQVAKWTREAMERKARAGHVTGGLVFGYNNVRVDGHVERRINEAEAAIVRQIFEWSTSGQGIKAIAKALNAAGAVSPRVQQGRSQTWSPSSVREVLHRDLYRGVIVWNRTRKRNARGEVRVSNLPASDWITVDAPMMRIVPDTLWQAAHARLASVRSVYLQATSGRPFGRPPLGDPSKYLLTNFTLCGCCGGPMRVRSRKHSGGERLFFYGCSGYHERGQTVCSNGADVPMVDADDMVIEALLDDVLDASLVHESIDEAVRLLMGDQSADHAATLEAELSTVETQRRHLVNAIAVGGQLDGLLEALKAREARRSELKDQLLALRRARIPTAADAARVRSELTALASSWRKVLANDPTNARPIITRLLNGRVTITPDPKRRQWELQGEGTLAGLFSREIFPSGWRPHRDSNPGFSLERAAS
jgi:site-specific DNA recombinase